MSAEGCLTELRGTIAISAKEMSSYPIRARSPGIERFRRHHNCLHNSDRGGGWQQKRHRASREQVARLSLPQFDDLLGPSGLPSRELQRHVVMTFDGLEGSFKALADRKVAGPTAKAIDARPGS